MNKGAHISLAHYLLEKEELKGLGLHRRAFLMGSILPDCLPSFLTTRHNITDTFDLLKSEVDKITIHYKKQRGITKYFCIHLGMIMHYLADYFTFPHNPGFCGKVKDHIEYERSLLISINQYFRQEPIFQEGIHKVGQDDYIDYVLKMHGDYLTQNETLEMDCYYITTVCFSVASYIVKYLIQDRQLEKIQQEIAA